MPQGRWTIADNGAICDNGKFSFEVTKFKKNDKITIIYDGSTRTVSWFINGQPVYLLDNELRVRVPASDHGYFFLCGFCRTNEVLKIVNRK